MKHHGTLSIRVNDENPNHHIWLNNGIYWCSLTVHRPDFTKQRVRASLGTHDVAEARRKRDALCRQYTILAKWGEAGCQGVDWGLATVS